MLTNTILSCNFCFIGKQERELFQLKDIEQEEGEFFHLDLRAEWRAVDPSERYDPIPEIFNGHNIADFVDPNITQVGIIHIVRGKRSFNKCSFTKYIRSRQEEDCREPAITSICRDLIYHRNPLFRMFFGEIPYIVSLLF